MHIDPTKLPTEVNVYNNLCLAFRFNGKFKGNVSEQDI